MILPFSMHDKLPNPIFKSTDSYQAIKTQESLTNKVLDIFPKEIWSNKNLRWLFPASKSGVFELHTYMRLMEGLKDQIVDREERRDWIVQNMIHSFCATYATWLFSSRMFLGKVYNEIKNYQELKGNVYQIDFL